MAVERAVFSPLLTKEKCTINVLKRTIKQVSRGVLWLAIMDGTEREDIAFQKMVNKVHFYFDYFTHDQIHFFNYRTLIQDIFVRLFLIMCVITQFRVVQTNLSVTTTTGGSNALTKSSAVMAIPIVPINPTKQIVVSNKQLCILVLRSLKAQENVYDLVPNEGKSVTSIKRGKIDNSAECDLKY